MKGSTLTGCVLPGVVRRGAVTAAQRAADQAEARANDACNELLSIKAELATTQQQLAKALTPATPMGALKSKLQGVHDALAGLHHKQSSVAQSLASPSLDAKVRSGGCNAWQWLPSYWVTHLYMLPSVAASAHKYTCKVAGLTTGLS